MRTNVAPGEARPQPSREEHTTLRVDERGPDPVDERPVDRRALACDRREAVRRSPAEDLIIGAAGHEGHDAVRVQGGWAPEAGLGDRDEAALAVRPEADVAARPIDDVAARVHAPPAAETASQREQLERAVLPPEQAVRRPRAVQRRGEGEGPTARHGRAERGKRPGQRRRQDVPRLHQDRPDVTGAPDDGAVARQEEKSSRIAEPGRAGVVERAPVVGAHVARDEHADGGTGRLRGSDQDQERANQRAHARPGVSLALETPLGFMVAVPAVSLPVALLGVRGRPAAAARLDPMALRAE
jgi:hypothetical protein